MSELKPSDQNRFMIATVVVLFSGNVSFNSVVWTLYSFPICGIFGFSLHNIHKFFASCIAMSSLVDTVHSFVEVSLFPSSIVSIRIFKGLLNILGFIFSLSIISLVRFRFLSSQSS